MKFNALCAIGHNIAHSLSDGMSMLLNSWDADVYSDAARSADGFVEIDFLSGAVVSGAGSPELVRALRDAPAALASLCKTQGAEPSVFQTLRVKYFAGQDGNRFLVEVRDEKGRQRFDEYSALEGRRIVPGKHPPVTTPRSS